MDSPKKTQFREKGSSNAPAENDLSQVQSPDNFIIELPIRQEPLQESANKISENKNKQTEAHPSTVSLQQEANVIGQQGHIIGSREKEIIALQEVERLSHPPRKSDIPAISEKETPLQTTLETTLPNGRSVQGEDDIQNTPQKQTQDNKKEQSDIETQESKTNISHKEETNDISVPIKLQEIEHGAKMMENTQHIQTQDNKKELADIEMQESKTNISHKEEKTGIPVPIKLREIEHKVKKRDGIVQVKPSEIDYEIKRANETKAFLTQLTTADKETSAISIEFDTDSSSSDEEFRRSDNDQKLFEKELPDKKDTENKFPDKLLENQSVLDNQSSCLPNQCEVECVAECAAKPKSKQYSKKTKPYRKIENPKETQKTVLEPAEPLQKSDAKPWQKVPTKNVTDAPLGNGAKPWQKVPNKNVNDVPLGNGAKPWQNVPNKNVTDVPLGNGAFLRTYNTVEDYDNETFVSCLCGQEVNANTQYKQIDCPNRRPQENTDLEPTVQPESNGRPKQGTLPPTTARPKNIKPQFNQPGNRDLTPARPPSLSKPENKSWNPMLENPDAAITACAFLVLCLMIRVLPLLIPV